MDIKLSSFNSIFELFATFNFAYSAFTSLKSSLTTLIKNNLSNIQKNSESNFEKILDELNLVSDAENFDKYFSNKFNYNLKVIKDSFAIKKIELISLFKDLGISENSVDSNLLEKRYSAVFFFFGNFCLILLLLSGIIDGFSANTSSRIVNFLYCFLFVINFLAIVGVFMYHKHKLEFPLTKTVIYLLLLQIIGVILTLSLQFMGVGKFRFIINHMDIIRAIIVLMSLFAILLPLYYFFFLPFIQSFIISQEYNDIQNRANKYWSVYTRIRAYEEINQTLGVNLSNQVNEPKELIYNEFSTKITWFLLRNIRKLFLF